MSQAGIINIAGSGTGVVETLTGNSGGPVSPTANNINTLGTGSVTIVGNPGTSTLTTQLTGLTNHNVLVGAGTATITNVAPSATSGIPLISQGAASDPAFGTAVVAGGGTGDTSFTAYAVICGGTTSTGALQNVSGLGTSGQILTSNGAGALPTWQASATTTWTDVTGATQTLAAQNGYITDRGGGVTYTLPASGALGDTIYIVGKSGLATITPNANQQILIGSASGTVGATGTAVANNVGDCITLICITSGASTVWRANSVIGTWTLN